MFTIENEMALLERYKLTPTELFTVKVILLATDNGDYTWVQKFAKLLKLRDVLISLQEKGIILKSFKIGSEGSSLSIEDIPFNQNFKKQFFRASFEMGEELFNTYPQFIVVGGVSYNARRVSKKYNDLEDAFAKYGKAIKNSPDLHQQITDDHFVGIPSLCIDGSNEQLIEKSQLQCIDHSSLWNNIELLKRIEY